MIKIFILKRFLMKKGLLSFVGLMICLSQAYASPEIPFYNRKEECMWKVTYQLLAYQECILKGISEEACVAHFNREMTMRSNPRNNPVVARKFGVENQRKWEILRNFTMRNIRKSFYVYKYGYSSQVYGPAPHMPQYLNRMAGLCVSMPGTIRWSSY